MSNKALERGGRGGEGGVPVPHSRSFYTTIPHPELLPSLDRILFLSQYRIPCQDLGETRFPSRGSTVLPPPPPPQNWTRRVKSRIPSRSFAFSRIPHCISVNSRIPKIPLQTLLNLSSHNLYLFNRNKT